MATITAVMSPLAADAWHTTLSQTDGRDKLMRLLQYVCKLLRALHAGRNTPLSGTLASKAAMIESALSASRQITRLFKWTSVYAKGKPRLQRIGTTSTTVVDLLVILTDVSLFSYYAFDNTAFAAKMGVLGSRQPRTFTQRGNRFWFVAITSGLFASILRLHALHLRAVRAVADMQHVAPQQVAPQQVAPQRKRVGIPDGPLQDACDDPVGDGVVDEQAAVRDCREIASKQNDVLLTFVRQAADALVAGSLGWDFGTHPAIVGACGSVSSAISLFQLWPRQ